MKYKRSLLKISGESLLGKGQFNIDPFYLRQYAEDIKEVINIGGQIAIVIGGGNIFRGLNNKNIISDRVQGDYMGMLATVINGMALQATLESIGVQTRLQTAIRMDQIAEPYIKEKAIKHLEKGRVVIFAAGTGNLYFTTDTAAVLRGIEIEAEVILKGTRVNGIYTSDPEKNSNAKKLKNISFKYVYNMGIKVMDMTAFALSYENKLPIIVFNINNKGNIKKILSGENIGTIVS